MESRDRRACPQTLDLGLLDDCSRLLGEADEVRALVPGPPGPVVLQPRVLRGLKGRKARQPERRVRYLAVLVHASDSEIFRDAAPLWRSACWLELEVTWSSTATACVM